MSTVHHPVQSWMGDTFSYSYDHGQGQGHGQYNYTDNPYGTSTSYIQHHSRGNSRPRVTMACKHCRQRKVRCDGQKPKCGLCSRLNRPCDYVKVTPEENAVLRDKKRQSKERKTAEQKAVRANLHKHDIFPIYHHPYRNAVVAHRNSFGSEAGRPDDRVSLQAPPLPQVGSSSSTSSILQPYLYDGRYQSTSVAATSLFDVGASLNTSRRPSLTTSLTSRTMVGAYPRKQSLDGYARVAEPRSRYEAAIASDASSVGVGLGVVPTSTFPIQGSSSTFESQASYSYAASSYNTFRTVAAEPVQRYLGALAPQPEFDVTTSPACYQPHSSGSSGSGSYFDHREQRSSVGDFRSTPNGSFEHGASLSPSVASPAYLSTVPALERVPSSSSLSGASASPCSYNHGTSPQHDDSSLWSTGSGQMQGQFVQSQYAYRPVYDGERSDRYHQEQQHQHQQAQQQQSFVGDSSNTSDSWSSHVPMAATQMSASSSKEGWDPVVSLYMQQSSGAAAL